MKKSRRELSGPRAVVNYKNRAVTEVATKRKPFQGFAGVRNKGADFSEEVIGTTDNIEAGINGIEENTVTEIAVEANNPSTDTSTVSSDLNVAVETGETAEIDGLEMVSEINDADDVAGLVPTMDNTKKEIVAHAEQLGIEIKGWWGKKKILDEIQG